MADREILAVWKTQRTAVPIAAVVLKYGPHARHTPEPLLTILPAQHVMGVLSQELACAI